VQLTRYQTVDMIFGSRSVFKLLLEHFSAKRERIEVAESSTCPEHNMRIVRCRCEDLE
jgi:hypothetical protein